MLDVHGLHVRAALFRCVREFFYLHNFLEVDSPIRQPVIIPESNIVPLTSESHYLQTSPELCMKRLLAVGCKDIFQICPCFRKDERGRHHLEEFQMLEWYRHGEDYRRLMQDCDELLGYIVNHLKNYLPADSPYCNVPLLDSTVLEKGSELLTVADAFNRYSPVPLARALLMGTFDQVLVEHVEPNLGSDRPLILYAYPKQLASLARIDDDEPQVAERFELYISGLELANGFSELTDSCQQRLRFEKELFLIKKRGGSSQKMPEKFLAELAGIDRAAGIAFGLDRLLMLLLGKNTLDEVVTFSPNDL